MSVVIDNVDHVPSNAINSEETVAYECHVQRLQSQSRDGCEQKRNLQNDIRGQTANECNQTSENTFHCQTAPAEQKALHQQSGAR